MGSCGMTMTKRVIFMNIVLAINLTHLKGLPILSRDIESGFVFPGQVLAESGNVTKGSRHLDGTVRVDPLDNFKKYRGGYDISNRHYWSSTAFTGIHGYTIAAIWFLCGLGYCVFVLVRTSCCKSIRKLKNSSSLCLKQCYLQPFLWAVFFTLLAVTACGLVLGGNSKFTSRAKTVVDVIINAADGASNTIKNTTGAMKEMNKRLREVDGSFEATEFLTSTSQRFDSQVVSIETHASENRYGITTVIISLTLVVVIALVVFGVLKFQTALQVLIVFCWIFTALCWLFFGVYFFLQNFEEDTCRALEGFQQDPYNNSLSSILPCDNLLSAKLVLTDVSAGIYNLVNKVNQNISGSYGNIVQICNPFSSPPMYEYQPLLNCPPTSIPIGDIPRVLKMLACPDSNGGTCNGGVLIPANHYKTIEAYSSSIQTLLDAYPGMENLVQCHTVKDAFTEILQKHCKPLKRYVRMVWMALVFLSLVLVALALMWTIGAHHEQNHHSLSGSVRPNYADMVEFGTTKSTNDYDAEPGPNRE